MALINKYTPGATIGWLWWLQLVVVIAAVLASMGRKALKTIDFSGLKHLNPKPGSQFSSANIPYVVPDAIVT